MKKIRRLFFLSALTGLLISTAGCAKDYADDIDDLKNRVTALEELTKSINAEIVNINSILTAHGNYEQITGVEELADNSGYRITFSKDGQVTRTIEVKHGNGQNGKDAPVIGVGTHTDGKLYWTHTLEDQTAWLKGPDGEMVPVGTVPTLGVDAGGYWTIDLKDGSGAKRMKDSSGNDVKATGRDGALGFTQSADGRYAIFSISGTQYTFEISAFSIGFDAYDIIYVEIGKVRTLNIILPENLKQDDFTAISAKIEGKNGGAADVVTRAAATAQWQVALTKPTYKTDKTIQDPAKVEITAPAGATVGDAAVLTVSLIDAGGNTVSASRAIEVVDVTGTTYSPTNNIFTLATAIGDPSSVLITVTGNQTAAQKIVIPAEYTAENTPVITLLFNEGKNFAISDANAATLTIDAPTYDGMFIIEGKDNTHEAVKNGASAEAVALEVTAPLATVMVQNIKITGKSVMEVSPNTFVVREAEIGAAEIRQGSVQVEATATVSGTLTSSCPHPIVIAGTVTDKIAASLAPVKLQQGAATKEVQAAGITVARGAVVDGHVTSVGTAPVEIKGEVKGNTTAPDATDVEIGDDAKIAGDLHTNENANVVLSPNSEIKGEVVVPVACANISIGDKAYGSLDNAVIAAVDGNVINLKAGTYALNEPVLHDITLKGCGVTDVTIQGEITAASSLALEGLHVDAASATVGRGTITMTGSNVKLKLTDGAITQRKTGTADAAMSMGIAVAFLPQSGAGNVGVELVNSTIYLLGERYQSGIYYDCQNSYSATITFDNSSIVTKNYQYANDTYSRGITPYGGTGDVITLRNNSSIRGVYYPLNLRGDNSTINIENSILEGYGTINARTTNSTYNIKNSTLTGRNYYSGSSSDFATVVLNEEATGNRLNFDGSTITNVMTNSCREYLGSVKGANNTFNFTGSPSRLTDTKKDDPQMRLPYLIQVSSRDVNPTITGEDNIIVSAYKYAMPVQYWGDLMYGEGTAANPYRVLYNDDWALIGNGLPLDAHYVQMRDLVSNIQDNKGHMPIGKTTAHFNGVYDGDGYTISNLSINRSSSMERLEDGRMEFNDNIGLFGVIGLTGVVRNVHLVGSTAIKGTGTQGNSISVGAIAGKCLGSIENCSNELAVISTGSKSNHTGGIVGWLMSDNQTVQHVTGCVNKGNVSETGAVGGIIGLVSYTSTSTRVADCRNSGNLTGSAGNVQGIIGSQLGVTIVTENNTNSGTVTEN